MTESTESPTWLEETAALMNARQGIRLREIAEECNVSIAWLSKLQTGRLTDASVKKLQTVNAWLKIKALAKVK